MTKTFHADFENEDPRDHPTWYNGPGYYTDGYDQIVNGKRRHCDVPMGPFDTRALAVQAIKERS